MLLCNKYFYINIVFFLSFHKAERTGAGTSLVSPLMRNLHWVLIGDSAQSNNIMLPARIALLF